MPRRYRLFVIAIAGLAFAFSGQTQVGAQQPERQASEQQQQPEPSPLPIRIIESQEAAEARQRSEQEAEQREKDDLVAQQGMNTATQRMADYGWWQTLLVLIGTSALIWTLFLTRQANRAAVQSAKAAQDALNLERPWMVPFEMHSYWFMGGSLGGKDIRDTTLGFVVAWRNVGKTPARHVRVFGRWVAQGSHEPTPSFEFDPSTYSSIGGIVGPGGDYHTGKMWMDEDTFELFKQDKVFVFVGSTCFYKTLSGDEIRRTDIVYQAVYRGTYEDDTGKVSQLVEYHVRGESNSMT